MHAHYANRWSSRAFDSRPVADEVLYTVLEAARWVPSSGNGQPWRFIVARTEEERRRFASFIRPANREWSDHAPVLILLISYTLNANGTPSGSHAFDEGTAWGTIASQAALLGLNTRAIGGYDRELARVKFIFRHNMNFTRSLRLVIRETNRHFRRRCRSARFLQAAVP
ncbi:MULTISPECIES: nitroreductase family protein [Paenibacillus]|nr:MULTISPECIES: nitroreductase family protein [Paenibacillus]